MNEAKLNLWRERLERSEKAYDGVSSHFAGREEIYLGRREIRPVVSGDGALRTQHVRNLVSEMIESQIDSSIPYPKVTPRRKQDEDKAKLIEDMLRSELDRLPFEEQNDMMERTVPIQGGGFFLVEWDGTKRTHSTVGELSVSVIHPMWVVPQEGVYTSVSDMDYFILKLPQTKEYIKRRYGVDVSEESESEPGIKSARYAEEACDLITQYIAYYRGKNGGVGIFSWVNDRVLCDLPDYQADGETEELELAGYGRITVPRYKPDMFPLVLQRNVSVFGQLLGESDVDRISDQQNTMNRLECKVIDKLIKSGSYISLPDDASIKVDSDEMKIIRPGTPQNKAMIDVYNLEGDIGQDLSFIKQVYEEARQTIGITDSYQGRSDSTAQSGVAKQFAAAQTAGRFESKRILKNAAYAALFELMFRFKLAYADEPRPIITNDVYGERKYREFDRREFLEQDAAGGWFWNDMFTFSCDETSGRATNRESMWEETRQNLTSGAFGDVSKLETLILFWSKLDMLHYPGAKETKTVLEERLSEERRKNESEAERGN